MLYAAQQGRKIDVLVAVLMQFTVWFTHLGTHYWNEYGDYEVDKFNQNAGAWTGGSKVLRADLLPRSTARNMGVIFFILAFLAGFSTVWRYLVLAGTPPTLRSWPAVINVISHIPWDFVLFCFSVAFVAVAYSLPPFRLSANALGELCVSYVLTFVTPVVGLLSQGGRLDSQFCLLLLPLFIVNASRMIVMNIPDRKGDEQGGKVTSVVLLGEERAAMLNTLLYVITYVAIVPQLPLPYYVKLGYYAPLPFRWWQSLRVSAKKWWKNKELTDSIPFVESLYVLTTVVCLCLGMLAEANPK